MRCSYKRASAEVVDHCGDVALKWEASQWNWQDLEFQKTADIETAENKQAMGAHFHTKEVLH